MPSHIKLSLAMASRSNGDTRAAATNGTSIKALIVLPPKAKMIAKVQIVVDATLVMIDVVKGTAVATGTGRSSSAHPTLHSEIGW